MLKYNNQTEFHATFIILGGAVNKHPLLVLRAIRAVLRSLHSAKFGWSYCQAYRRLMYHLLAGAKPQLVDGVQAPDTVDFVAWAAEMRKLPPFNPTALEEC